MRMTIPKNRLISGPELFYPETSAAPAGSFRRPLLESQTHEQVRECSAQSRIPGANPTPPGIGQTSLAEWVGPDAAGETGSRYALPIASRSGTGVIWSAVIPAKAGIHAATMALRLCTSPSGLELLGSKESELPLDSRFRGNDCGFERPCLANDTSTQNPVLLAVFWRIL